MKPLAAKAVAGALFLLLAPAQAVARGELQAGPTLLEISPGGNSTRLRLGNSGDSPVAAQVRVYAWTQVNGEDHLQPSDHLVASPPISEVAPGGEQLVRIVLVGPAASGSDLSFRVVVDELPGDEQEADTAVKVRMRYLIPAFVRARGASEPEVRCTLHREAARLACHNRGGKAARFGAALLVGEGSAPLSLSEGLYGYVLPGSTRHWDLPATGIAGIGAGALTLSTQLNGQAATVVVDRQP